MEVRCLSPSKDTIILKAILEVNPVKGVTVNEILPTKIKSLTDKVAFSAWPYIKEEGKEPSFYGLRAVLQYLYGAKLNAATLTINESLFTIADSIYTSAVPTVAANSLIIVKDQVLAASKSQLQSLLSIAAKFQTTVVKGTENYGLVYLNSILSVLSLIGIDVSPCSATPLSVETSTKDLISDEALQYAFNKCGITVRYAMSPPPEKPMYLTTPIYYVNGVPHIGHIFTTTLVETLASWYKLRGFDCIYSSGTDEHGLKVQTTAQDKGFTPQEWCDQTSNAFRIAFDDFDLHPDVFIRTTDPHHKEIATKLWVILKEKGYIYEGTYEGWYSKREECFVPENQVVEQTVDGQTVHINSEDGAPLEWSSEKNWMFKLSAMEGKLLNWMDNNPNCVTPKPYYNQVYGMVKAGLNDISISRQKSKVSWGVPVPGDDTQTMYVWIDALANYLTVAGWDGTNYGRWPADLHTVGKDIVKFHAIYWPAFLIAADITPYKRLLVHGWWTRDETKMSKSLGNTLDPKILCGYWGLEPVKYYLLREATLVTDSDYSDVAMLKCYNADLAKTFANLVLRIISQKLNPEMTIPAPNEYTDEDKQMIEEVSYLPGTVDHCIQFGQTRIALSQMWNTLQNLNLYTQKTAPWVLKKTDPERWATVTYLLAESMRMFCTCLLPFMRQTATTVLNGLGAGDIKDPAVLFTFGALKPGSKMTQVPVLFPMKELPE